MQNAIHLEANQVPAQLRGAYSGKKFKAIVAEQVTIHSDAGLWSGGSRDYWSGVNVNTGDAMPLPGQNDSPWNASRQEVIVNLAPGFVVVKHSMFRGTDMGLTFFVHPENAAKLLPTPSADLSAIEKLVLRATRSFKSSYAGQDRYQIAERDYSCKAMVDTWPSREQWNVAKESLIAKKLLNRAGAITPAGRNASH
jgi:hypothetical protein